MHEAELHEENSFCTLTYAADSLPGPSLVYRDFQLFMKRLRRWWAKPLLFYMCGEYGETYQRPHFHVLLFGCSFPDRLHLRGKGALQEFTSVKLEELWGKGACCIGQVTFESAAYVARYMIVDTQRFVIDQDGVFTELRGEFTKMSLRPPIAKAWLDKFGGSDVFPSGEVVVRGHLSKAPRYYDKRHELVDPVSFERVRRARMREADKRFDEGSRSRLLVREAVAQAGLALKRRS